MAKLIVYDAGAVLNKNYDRPDCIGPDPITDALLELFDDAMGRLKPILPESFLLRAIYDQRGDYWDKGLEYFLKNCLENGHDRYDPNIWGSINTYPFDMKELFIPNEITMASRVLRDKTPRPFPKWRAFAIEPRFTVVFLFMNPNAYVKLKGNNSAYGQKDVSIRQSGLISLVLFDMNSSTSETRLPFETEIVPDSVNEIVNELRIKNYFPIL